MMIYILLGAVAISLVLPFLSHGNLSREDLINAVVISAIVIFNAFFGFIQEMRAEDAIALLKKLSAPNAKVRRNGIVQLIPSREIVPGDLVLLEAGDRTQADGRIVVSSSLEVDESSLTGESVPVSKTIETTPNLDFGSPGMMYAGTHVTRGSGEVVVLSIGLGTEIGKVTSLVMNLKPPPTPLQIQLKSAGRVIASLVLGLCAVIYLLGVARGIPAFEMFFTAVTLAVAAVPEGLPAIVTICLALGVQRMTRKKALIRRLDSIETLGSVTVICADKTGTMTENRMQVRTVWVPPGSDELKALEIGAACNRAELPDIGDPMEVALIDAARKKNLVRLPIVEEEEPFTSETKYMVTIHRQNGRTLRYLKGAPEVIAGLCPEANRAEMLRENEKLSAEGCRVIAVAEGTPGEVVCRGLIAFIDPPRRDLDISIKQAKEAGVRTIMITGDHPATALAVAHAAGLATERVIIGQELEKMSVEELQAALQTTSVFARVQPAHKVKILNALQESGEVVAMSGDGVNDAPALKRSHIGIAMGLKGTEIARESAAMVLMDDNYATIVTAIAEGRRIYDNIKKSVLFLMRSNIGEVAIIALAIFIGIPLPFMPLQILWMNLVTDSFPALALAAEEGERDIMQRPPRGGGDGIFTGQWSLIALTAALSTVVTLGLFAYSLKVLVLDLDAARTVALTATIVFQMFLSVSTHTDKTVLSEPVNSITRWLIGSIALSLLLHLVLLYTPLNNLFKVVPLSFGLWVLIIAINIIAFLIIEGAKWWDGINREAGRVERAVR